MTCYRTSAPGDGVPEQIIDCHCHAGTGDGLTGPWDTRAPLAAYLRRAEAAGIRKTILFSAFHSGYEAANRQVAAIIAHRPDRFFGFVFVHGERDRGRMLSMVGRYVLGHGFRGIKVHRHDAHISREVCHAARLLGVPVLYDIMGEVSAVHLLAEEYPAVDFIIPHLGSFADDWRAQVTFIDALARYPNIYTDTSGVRRFDLLVRAFRLAGPRKILFGTDGPWLHPGLELEKVRALGLKPETESRVLSGNILRLLGRKRRLRQPVGAERRIALPSRGDRESPDPWAAPSSPR